MHIKVAEKIHVPRSKDKVLAFLQNMSNLQKYEPKIDSARIIATDKTNGRYFASGFFAHIPWNGEFSYQITKSGFTSRMISKSTNIRVRGGFVVTTEKKDSCSVLHYENYDFPNWLFFMGPLLRAYLKRAILSELKNIYKFTTI